MVKREALKNIRRMTVAEKLARLSAADTAYVRECIEQAVQDEQSTQRECPPVQDGALPEAKNRKQADKQ